jgi:hypothetical protein
VVRRPTIKDVVFDWPIRRRSRFGSVQTRRPLPGSLQQSAGGARSYVLAGEDASPATGESQMESRAQIIGAAEPAPDGRAPA